MQEIFQMSVKACPQAWCSVQPEYFQGRQHLADIQRSILPRPIRAGISMRSCLLWSQSGPRRRSHTFTPTLTGAIYYWVVSAVFHSSSTKGRDLTPGAPPDFRRDSDLLTVAEQTRSVERFHRLVQAFAGFLLSWDRSL